MGKFESKIQSVKGLKRGWKLYTVKNGKEEEIADVGEKVILRNERFGELNYGKSPTGPWDQWAFHENGGGGAVTVPYAIIGEKIFIGMMKQGRDLQANEPVWNVPRGCLQGESHEETAYAEFQEETGVDAKAKLEVNQLPGEAINPNSAFFETWVEGEGVYLYSVYFPDRLLEKNDDGNLVMKEKVKPLDDAEKLFGNLTFLPLAEACQVGDSFTLAAIARLIGSL